MVNLFLSLSLSSCIATLQFGPLRCHDLEANIHRHTVYTHTHVGMRSAYPLLL